MSNSVYENKWQVGVDGNTRKVFLESTGFDEFDVRMYVNGNFGGVQGTVKYAERIAEALNKFKVFP